MRPIWISVFCLAASTAAACPTGADLSTGIRVTEDDGTVHLFKGDAGGLVMETISVVGEDPYANALHKGVYVAAFDVGTDYEMTFRYQGAAEDLPVPAPGLSQIVRTKGDDGEDVFAENQFHEWTDGGTFTIGACSYPAVAGLVIYRSDIVASESLRYLPDLGIALLVGYGEGLLPTESYSFTAIEAVQ